MRGKLSVRRVAVVTVIGGALALAGCDDDGISPTTIDLEAVVGIYDPTTLAFDPQGSAPPADVLPLIQGTQPQLVISQTRIFQVAFLDPVDHFIKILPGTVQATADGVRLVFDRQTDADELLLPRNLSLVWDAAAGTLGFSGTAQISRSRLLQLFPDLYGDEQLFDPTPGTLSVEFTRRPPAS